MALNAIAITRYVDLNSPNPALPYTSWSTAATNIQEAVDAALSGDLILVTNGTYQTGERLVTAEVNRVAITNALEVRSVNGPSATVIQGSSDNGGVRGVYLASGAALSGFTLTNGNAPTYGGGVRCESTNAFVTNCVITGNTADFEGGGVFGGTVRNCVLSKNTASSGGGAAQARLLNCQLSGNTARGGGGAFQCVLANCTVTENGTYLSDGSPPSGAGVSSSKSYNCIIYYNTNASGDTTFANYGFFDQLNHCCTTPLPSIGFNIDTDPLFVDAANGDFHLASGSPCVDLGNNSYTPAGHDLDGNTRTINGHVDLGAFESPFIHIPTTLYVDVNSTNPIAPYTNWSTAASVLQDAADVSQAGDEILVAPGVYKTGGQLMDGMTNRIVLARSVKLKSTHGPFATSIEGFKVPDTGWGESAVRCVYLGLGAGLTGFTITNGATRYSMSKTPPSSDHGGGIWCFSTSEVVSNCVIINNRASRYGGGVYQGTVHHSLILSNSGSAGAGALGAILNQCIIRGNSGGYGGGVNGSTLTNCLVVANSAAFGGGAMGATLRSCTVSANAAEYAGGVWGCALENSIIFGNTAIDVPNQFDSTANYCCTYPLPAGGLGNITNNPMFVSSASGNFRLQTNSPCIDSGNNASVSGAIDLDGRQRIIAASVDIGAYEFQGAGMGEFMGWLQMFGILTDGSADFADTDSDHMSNHGEWRSDTIPTNAVSVLRMISATNSGTGANVTWQSVATRVYRLERSTNLTLASPFQTVATNIAGAVGLRTFADSSATNSGPYFYRVGVE